MIPSSERDSMGVTEQMDAAIDEAFADTPEAPPSAPATAEPPTDTPAPQSAPPDSDPAQPRDAQGKYAPKPTAPEAPAPVAPPASPDTPNEPQTDEVDLSKFKPLGYKSGGQDFQIEGSAVAENGAWIPSAQLPFVTQLLASGRHAQQAARDFGAVRQQDRQSFDAKLAEAQAEMSAKDELIAEFEKIRAEAATDPEGVLAWLQDPRVWELAKAKSAQKLSDAKLAAYTARETERKQHDERQAQIPVMQRELATELDRTLEHLKTLPKYAGLPALDRQMIEARLARRWGQMFRPATAQDEGFRAGETVFDKQPIWDEVQEMADFALRLMPKPTKAAVPTNPTPPAARGKATPPPIAAPAKDQPVYSGAADAFEDGWNK